MNGLLRFLAFVRKAIGVFRVNRSNGHRTMKQLQEALDKSDNASSRLALTVVEMAERNATYRHLAEEKLRELNRVANNTDDTGGADGMDVQRG